MSAVFDPKAPGPMRVITDDADEEYLVKRSIELLHNYRDPGRIELCLSLLALAQCKMDEANA